MLNALLNIFKIAELRNKVLFTIAMLAVFRLGHFIPLPGVDPVQLNKLIETTDTESAFGRAMNQITMLSGGSLSHSTLFGLGVMPYITASIIFQLLMTVWPKLKKIQQDGPTGSQKINEWQRYATIFLCILQGFGWLKNLQGGSVNVIYPQWAANPMWWVMALAALTAGTMFLMWIGEQIDKHGIGNGVSMIIMAGIIINIPAAIMQVWANYGPGQDGKIQPLGLAFLILGFVVVVGGAVLLTVAQRRIPLQMAKHSAKNAGKTVMGGNRSFLPLKINHSGVMPVVFASSLMIFPGILFAMLSGGLANAAGSGGLPGWIAWLRPVSAWLESNFHAGNFPYMVGEIILIYFFSYFWITVQFNPEEISKQMRDSGSFIPGLRPGPRTAEYLEAVMNRITYVGAAFLAVLAVLPMLVSTQFGVPPTAAQFLGGTGLLIVVSVVLDFIKRVEANLLMRNYAGFLGEHADDSPRLRSRFATEQ